MTSYVTPKKNSAYIFYVGLVSQANVKILQANPTLAAADFNVSIDGGALNALGTTPTVTPAAGRMVKISLSAAEMNGDNITVVCSDSAGAEWCDLIVSIQTSARQIDDLAYPATSGRALNVSAGGVADADAVAISTDAAAADNLETMLDGTGGQTLSLKQLNVVNSAGDAIVASATGSNGQGINASGNGTGAGIKATGGATGHGLAALGGATSGDGVNAAAATSGKGINALGVGTTMPGILATGGATSSAGISAAGGGTGAGVLATGGGTGHGISAIGGATSGDGASLAAATSGHGLTATGVGTTKHGINAAGGSTSSHGIAAAGGGTGAGLRAIGGATGVGINAVGGGTSGDGIKVTTTSGHGMNLAPLGSSMHGLLATGGDAGTSDGIKATAGTGGVDFRANQTGNLTGNVSGSVGSVTGAVGSVTGAVGSVTGAVGSVTGAVGSVTGSVGSVAAGGIAASSFAAGAIDAAAIAANAIGASELAADAVTEIRSIVSGTSDSGTTTTMVDAARTEADTDYWKGCLILFTSGTINGQSRLITAFDPVTDTITFAPAATQAVATQTYEILPAGRADLQLWQGTAANALVSGRVDSSTGAMAAGVVTAAAVATDAIDADAIATDAVTELQAGLATAAALATVQADTDDIQTRLPAALVGGRMDSSLAAAGLATDAVDEIVDAVWDEPTSGHATAGTTGKALTDAGGAGDPWSTLIPGAYGAGTAGKILGDNINATIASRATQASVDTLDDYVDTEVAAIKAKTDLIPASPAAVSDIPTAIQNADALLKRDMSSVTGEAARSPLNAHRKLMNKIAADALGTTLTVYKEDDTTVAFEQAITSDAAADPITALDTV